MEGINRNSRSKHTKQTTMGIFGNSEENDIDQKGSIQNNISFTESVTTYGNEVVILLSIIAGVKVFEVIIYAYKTFRRNLKRNLTEKPGNGGNLSNSRLEI